MTGRERILTTLSHREPDRIPLDIGGGNACGIMLPAYQKLIEHTGIPVKPRCGSFAGQTAWMDEEACRYFQTDARRLQLPIGDFWGKVNEESEYYWYVDEWRRTLRMPKVNGHYFDIIGYPLKDKPYEEYQWPEPIGRPDVDRLENVAGKLAADSRAAICMPTIGNGFLQLGAQLFGYDDWFAMLIVDQRKVEAFLDRLLEQKIRYWREILGRLGGLIDIACEDDDLGTQNGPWLDPKLWRRLMKPRLAQLVAQIKRIRPDVKMFFHSCGSIYEFIPDLIEIGIDILNPIQVGAARMDTKRLKKEFGKEIVFWGGGVDTQRVLPLGTPQEVQDEVKRRIDDLAPGGGFVFAAVHNIQSDVPPQNIVAMIETLRKFGSY